MIHVSIDRFALSTLVAAVVAGCLRARVAETAERTPALASWTGACSSTRGPMTTWARTVARPLTLAVRAVPVSGGAVTTLAQGSAYPLALSTDGTAVYWTADDGSLRSVPVGGGAVVPLVTGAGIDRLLALLVDGLDIVYEIQGLHFEPSELARVPTTGGDSTSIAVAVELVGMADLALVGGHFYWYRGSEIWRMPRWRVDAARQPRCR